MAFCGSTFLDERKADEITWDHSLDNVLAFSTKEKQMSAVSKEGLLIYTKDGKGVDHREKIIYNNKKFVRQSYYTLCQMTAMAKKGKTVGSCSGIWLKGKSKLYLTCAHNIVDCSVRTKQQVPYSLGFIYGARQGANKWGTLSKVDPNKTLVHPKYNGEPDCGFDLGIMAIKSITTSPGDPKIWKLPKKANHPQFRDVQWSSAEPGEIKEGMDIEVAGYPGEKDGWPYTATGKIIDVVKTSLGGWLLFYNADATPGNSGSCIMVTDEDFLKKRGMKQNCKKLIIGVHNAHCSADDLNYGTLITPQLFEWIRKGID